MPIKAKHREIAWSLTEFVVIAVAALVTSGPFTPRYSGNRILYRALRRAIRAGFNQRLVPQALRRAQHQGLVRVTVSRSGFVCAQVTDAGRQLLARRQLEGAAADRPKRWDGKWRVLIFDVPERRRRDRDVLRRTLQNFGFHQLQESVWIYPFDCHELVAVMREAYRLSHVSVRYLIASTIEDDTKVRMHFNV